MAKSQIYSYSFNAVNKTVVFNDFTTLNKNKLLAIINVTVGKTIYTTGTALLSCLIVGNVVTLNTSVSTSGMSNTDELLILYNIDIDSDLPLDPAAVRNGNLTYFLDSVATIPVGNADIDVIPSLVRYGTDGSTFNNTLKVVSVNPGNIYELMCINPTPDVLYLKFYDAIPGDSPTVGATAPAFVYIIPPQQVLTTAVSVTFAPTASTTMPGTKELNDNGIKKLSFTRGCQVAIVKGFLDTDNTAPASGCILQLKHYF